MYAMWMWVLGIVMWLEITAGRLLCGILMVRPPKSIEPRGGSSTCDDWGRPRLISFSGEQGSAAPCLDESSSAGPRGRPHAEFLSAAFKKIAKFDTEGEKEHVSGAVSGGVIPLQK